MKRWHKPTSCYIENDRVDLFLNEIIEVCKKHGFLISHEDHHGSFEIERFEQRTIDWLLKAVINY